jgi:CheY-like chemotaxis protein
MGESRLVHRILDVALDSIHKTVRNRRRFEQVSVAVVDFDMPSMNGLDFCQNIENPAIRKILQTGKADERTAVNAFNDGIIDCFILKQAEDAMPYLNRAIGRMQHLYFSDFARSLSDVLALDAHPFTGSHAFMRDPVFARCFAQIREQLDIVEYYLSCAPDGFLMLNAAGIPYFLSVCAATQWLSRYECSENGKAPRELLAALSSGETVSCRGESEGRAALADQKWHACLHPAGDLNSYDFYVYSLTQDLGGFNLEAVLSYDDYLNGMDQKALSRF